jgi:hypothetical protein
MIAFIILCGNDTLHNIPKKDKAIRGLCHTFFAYQITADAFLHCTHILRPKLYVTIVMLRELVALVKSPNSINPSELSSITKSLIFLSLNKVTHTPHKTTDF